MIRKARHTYLMLHLLRDNYSHIPMSTLWKFIKSIVVWWFVQIRPVHDNPEVVIQMKMVYETEWTNITSIWFKRHDEWVIPSTSFWQDMMFPGYIIESDTKPAWEDIKNRQHLFWLKKEQSAN